MPITHTNRKGVTFYLGRGVTKTGKPRYFLRGIPTKASRSRPSRKGARSSRASMGSCRWPKSAPF